jgi:hypothetical protein
MLNLLAGFVASFMFSTLTAAQDWGGQATNPSRQGAAASASTSNTGGTKAPFDPRDISGVWRLAGGNVPRVPTLSNDVPPMTAWGEERFNANKPSFGPRAVVPALGNDPIAQCNPLGLPRIHFFSWPLEIVQTRDKVIQVFEWTRVYRDIWIDGRDLPIDWEPRWYGYSVGRWEGDTFVVDSIGYDERTWADHFGHPHSEEMRLQERYRRVDRDTLELTMTLNDPKTYTKPWVSETKILKPLPQQGWPYRELREEICAPVNEQFFNDNVRNPAGGVR